MTVTSAVKAIQDIMRQDVGVDGDAQRISQLIWMLFLKIFDDRDKTLELKDDRYKSPIPKRFQWRTWAADPAGETGDKLLYFVNNELFPYLKDLTISETDKRGQVVKNVFGDAYNYMKSGTLMRQVINKINEIDFNRKDDRHLLGDVYESILKDLQSAGNAGEYYTPRAVTQFAVEMVDPKLGEKILDPACGTGGFLACAIEHIRSTTNQVKTTADERKLQASIHGIEKKPLPHMLCVTNMILHGIDSPANIEHDNALAKPLHSYGQKNAVQVIVTNPPFGGVEEPGIELNFPTDLRTRETADLFLTLIMRRLRNEGRAAIVLPDGTLFGEGVKTKIKEKLLDECNLHTIVRLPNGVFSPYTSIKTNILFFEKGKPTKDVWYYEHPYPEGYKSYSKLKPMRIEEFAAEKEWWGGKTRRGRKENEFAWKVSADEIKAQGYNLDRKNPNLPEEDHGDPDELLNKYEKLLSEVNETRNALREQLATALGGGRS